MILYFGAQFERLSQQEGVGQTVTNGKTIETEDDIAHGLAALAKTDPRLLRVIEAAGPVPLRRSAGGFAGLVRIVISQQVSKASADAITARCMENINPLTPDHFLRANDETLRAIGLSRPKQRTLTAIAHALNDGSLNLETVADRSFDDAVSHMCAVSGIGPWTAEVYLLFCGGHRDIFPAGDLALQIAVGEALDLHERPDTKDVRQIAESWKPWRSVAARLFWAWYGRTRQRSIMPG